MLASAFIDRIRQFALLFMAVLLLAGCEESGYGGPKELMPVPEKLVAKMEKQNMDLTAPIYIRAYKESSELEVWKLQRDGKYGLLSTYSICKWSGKLGPKIKEGDRQAPEGFYTITPGQMNPKSNYYLSFNIGFPNAFDRSLGRTGTNIMVHGACSSAGCYSMTDEAAGQIYALARDSFRGGQRSFEVNLYPFRMTPENMAKHRKDPNIPFWTMLKEGSDHFAVTGKVPVVGVCGRRYVFDVDSRGQALNPSTPCPPYTVAPWIDAGVKAKQAKDNELIATLSAKYEIEDQAAAAKAEAIAQKAAEQNAKVAAGSAAKAVDPAAILAPATEGNAEATLPSPGTQPIATTPAAVDTTVAAIGGVPAPGVPLPVPSPIRPVVVAPAPPPEQPGFWSKMKKKLTITLPKLG